VKVNWHKFYNWSRWLHLYISTFLFISLLFFAVTGITLNNAWYDDNNGDQGEIDIELTTELIASLSKSKWDPDLNSLSALITRASGLKAPERVNLFPEYQEVIFEYRIPAGNATAFISAERAWIEYESGSILSLANALHKSRDSGATWGWLVDIVASGMILFALTGVIILFQNRRRRMSALASVALGVLTPVGIYFLFVPSIGQ
jgi:hypothetical protein